MAQLYQLVINLIQFGAVFVVPVALCHPGGLANLVVGIQLPGRKLAEGISFAPERNLCGGNQLGITARQGVFPLQVLHNLGRKGLGGHLRVDKGNAAVLCFQFFAEGRFQGCHGPGLESRLQGGHLLIVVAVFGVVEFIPGINIPADGCQIYHGVIFDSGKLRFLVDGVSLFKSPGFQETPGLFFNLCLPGSQIGAVIGDLRKSHCNCSFHIVCSQYSRKKFRLQPHMFLHWQQLKPDCFCTGIFNFKMAVMLRLTPAGLPPGRRFPQRFFPRPGAEPGSRSGGTDCNFREN